MSNGWRERVGGIRDFFCHNFFNFLNSQFSSHLSLRTTSSHLHMHHHTETEGEVIKEKKKWRLQRKMKREDRRR